MVNSQSGSPTARQSRDQTWVERLSRATNEFKTKELIDKPFN